MSYERIDPVLNAWAERHGILICIAGGDKQRRYFYTSSDACETFQVVIEPERDEHVRVDAHLIETWSGEVHCWWEVLTVELEFVLDRALGCIRDWFQRSER